ncbi:cyclin-dependent kinase 5-like [Bactrocera neohumeralis]|uniref:cyclin-dependent kinase 5-like n=1 Tax=Bactrocera neohumeralis TaxID=98809 RepID=UPI0021659597|nr:cyclin-dependent kinase 5-like [Bactrocera neohumeralis]
MLLHNVYDEAVDPWAVGAIFFELVFGVLLLPLGRVASLDGTRVEVDDTDVHRLIRLIYLLGTPTAGGAALAPPDYDEGVRRSLPQQRAGQLFPTADGHSDSALAAAMPRLIGTEGVALLQALLRCNPQERITSADALRFLSFS